MARERRDHTLQASALVNEAYLRLIDLNQMQWKNRAHFFAMSARVMRRILVDFARARRNEKRRRSSQLTLDEALLPAQGSRPRRRRPDERCAHSRPCTLARERGRELRYFGGLSLEETARHCTSSIP